MAKKSVAGTVSDPTIKFSDLVVDGQTYKLAYSFNALAEAEKAAGCNLLRGLESLTDLTAIQLRGLLYAAMTVAKPDITIEQVGSMVRFDTLPFIVDALAKAYMASMPAKKEQEQQVTPQTA